MTTLNIIGAGKLATALGILLSRQGLVTVGSLFSRRLAKAQAVCSAIGQGSAIDNLAAAADAELWLIATADDAIAEVADRLASGSGNWQGRIVFHCSGLHSSELLAPLSARGALAASLHPVHSFADPGHSARHFDGTFCTLEGAAAATGELRRLFGQIGARVIAIDAGNKPLYHAATAVASNHLVALLADSLAMLAAAGIGDGDARALLSPLVLGSASNALSLGPGPALTGPIARGDVDTLARHLEALARQTPNLLPPYLALARQALALATATNPPSAGQLAIAQLLEP